MGRTLKIYTCSCFWKQRKTNKNKIRPQNKDRPRRHMRPRAHTLWPKPGCASSQQLAIACHVFRRTWADVDDCQLHPMSSHMVGGITLTPTAHWSAIFSSVSTQSYLVDCWVLPMLAFGWLLCCQFWLPHQQLGYLMSSLDQTLVKGGQLPALTLLVGGNCFWHCAG